MRLPHRAHQVAPHLAVQLEHDLPECPAAITRTRDAPSRCFSPPAIRSTEETRHLRLTADRVAQAALEHARDLVVLVSRTSGRLWVSPATSPASGARLAVSGAGPVTARTTTWTLAVADRPPGSVTVTLAL